MKTFTDFIAYLLIRAAVFPFAVLPYDACLRLGRALTTLLFPIARKHRRIAEENLKHAFPDQDEAWRKRTVREHFKCLGMMVADALYGPRLNDRFFQERVIFEGDSKAIEQRAASAGTGVVLMCGHLGTWELLVQYTGRVMKGGGIYKPMSNRFVDAWYKRMREASGITLFTMDETGGVLRYLKKGRCVGIVSDQNAGRAGIFVDFLNRPASTFLGPVTLADLSGSHILFYTAIHDEHGKVRIRIQDLGRVDRSAFPDRDSAVRHYTQLWTRALEEQVRAHPPHYFWVHRRWKYTPEKAAKDEAERAARKARATSAEL